MEGARIAVVGGSLGGLRAAEQLRRAGHTGPVTLYGAEPYPPYNRPPLSKDVLADPDLPDAAAMLRLLEFRRRSHIDDVELRLGTEVRHADLGAGRLTWAADGRDGSDDFDGLVVATGLRPWRLPVPGPVAGRHLLRTVDDCLALRSALTPGARVVVVGGGFIGCETAGTLQALGHPVTVVEPTGPPLNRALGADLGAAIQRHHEGAGLDFVIGPGVTGFDGDDRVTHVLLDDGQRLPADVVIEAVGARPVTGWLDGNGLDLSDGVLCANDLAVVGAERAVAVGDVARFPHPLFDEVPRRVEHWSMPTDTAKRAAPTLLARLRGEQPDPEPFTPVPSFWSDQGELRLQSFGLPALGEARIVEGDVDALTDGVLVTYHRAGQLVGSVAVNLPPSRYRALRDAFTPSAGGATAGG